MSSRDSAGRTANDATSERTLRLAREAIYERFNGYWTSESETRRLAHALEAVADERAPCIHGDELDAWIASSAHRDPSFAAHLLHAEAVALLREFVDDEPCRYDHHGLCQTHQLGEKPCENERARALLDRIENGESA